MLYWNYSVWFARLEVSLFIEMNHLWCMAFLSVYNRENWISTRCRVMYISYAFNSFCLKPDDVSTEAVLFSLIVVMSCYYAFTYNLRYIWYGFQVKNKKQRCALESELLWLSVENNDVLCLCIALLIPYTQIQSHSQYVLLCSLSPVLLALPSCRQQDSWWSDVLWVGCLFIRWVWLRPQYIDRE